MEPQEQFKIKKSLKKLFPTASQIFVDTAVKECSVIISIDDYQGQFEGFLFEDEVQYKMVDFNDNYPFKYVFAYQVKY